MDNEDVAGGPVTDARAHALRARYHELFGGERFPVPVERLAEDLLGLHVEEAELDVSGMLLPAERTIYVNVSEPEPRRRFTVGHELGHWVCQCLEGRAAPLMCRAQDVSASADRLLEREANVFAAELLMPEEAVREAWAGEPPAARFGVSVEAMRWRLYSFGLVAERPS